MNAAGKIVMLTLITALTLTLAYAGVNVYSITNLCLFKKEVSIDNIDGKYLYMTIKLWLKNPSSISVALTGYAFDVYLNNTKCANAVNASKQTLSGQAITVFDIPIKVEYFKVLGASVSSEMLGYLATKRYDKIVLGINGAVAGEVFGYAAAKRINITESLQEIIDVAKQPSSPC